MDGRRKPESEHRRNTLSVRWSDEEHRNLTDEAWRRRQPAAELVREYVNEGLARDGACAPQDRQAILTGKEG